MPNLPPGAAKLIGQAIQRAFPFMKRLPESRLVDQPWYQMARMDAMVNEPSAMLPWARLRQMVRGRPNTTLLNPHAISMEFGGQGSPSKISADLESPANSILGDPETVHLGYLESQGARRSGAFATRHEQEMRPGRRGEPAPAMTMRDRQAAADDLMRTLRQAGFKRMDYSAVPGSRPRLYDLLTGYKSTPVDPRPGKTFEGYVMDIASPAQRELPLRGQKLNRPRLAEQFTPRTPTVLDDPYDWMRFLTTDRLHSRDAVEQALGISADAAVRTQLAREAPSGDYYFTQAGIDDVMNWLRNQQR